MTFIYDTWLTSDDAELREAVNELVFSYGAFYCGSKPNRKERTRMNRLLETVRARTNCLPKVIDDSITTLAQTNYGLD